MKAVPMVPFFYLIIGQSGLKKKMKGNINIEIACDMQQEYAYISKEKDLNY